jgi:hypothetical protein
MTSGQVSPVIASEADVEAEKISKTNTNAPGKQPAAGNLNNIQRQKQRMMKNNSLRKLRVNRNLIRNNKANKNPQQQQIKSGMSKAASASAPASS